MSQLLFIDLETVPTDDDNVIADIAATISPPGNYKKAETIEKWEQHEKKRAVDEAVARTSFDGAYGKIICVAYARDDHEVMSLEVDKPWYQDPDAFRECDLLHSLFTDLRSYPDLTFIGHNITWDLRMLYQRAVVNGIEPPSNLLKAMRAKPWELADTMLMWGGSDRDKRISLEKLCKILGIDSPKSEMNGSMVAQYYKEGRIDEIADYCRADVIAVRECYKRLSFAA